MSKDVRSKMLSSFGIVEYKPRVATCMVLMDGKQQATKVLEGMIGVLKLPAYKVVRVIVDKLANDLVEKKIQLWDPKYILQLSTEHPAVRQDKIAITHSADYLQKNPKDKAAAYKDLLALRDEIESDAL